MLDAVAVTLPGCGLAHPAAQTAKPTPMAVTSRQASLTWFAGHLLSITSPVYLALLVF